MNKLKCYFIAGLIASSATLVSQNLKLTEVSSGYLKPIIEDNVSALLRIADADFDEGADKPFDFKMLDSRGVLTQECKENIAYLWKKSHFRCAQDTIKLPLRKYGNNKFFIVITLLHNKNDKPQQKVDYRFEFNELGRISSIFPNNEQTLTSTPQGSIRIDVKPGNARIQYRLESNREWTVLPNDYRGENIWLNAGIYELQFSKDNYEDVYKKIEVNESDKIETITDTLTPKFAKLHFNVVSADDRFPFNKDTKRTIELTAENGAKIPIQLSGFQNSFDDNGKVYFGSLYENNVIPVLAGKYNINVNAGSGFFPVDTVVNLDVKNIVEQLDIKLIPDTVTLDIRQNLQKRQRGGGWNTNTIINGGVAKRNYLPTKITVLRSENDEYKVEFKDDKYLFELIEGEYLKENSGNNSFAVKIGKDKKEKTINVSRFSYEGYKIIADGCIIVVDNDFSDNYLDSCARPLKEGKHSAIIRDKETLSEYKKEFEVCPTCPSVLKLDMKAIKIMTENKRVDSLILVIKQKGEKDIFDTLATKNSSAQLLLPYGKYKLQLYSEKGGFKQNWAHRRFSGKLTISEKSKSEITVPHYSSSVTALSGDYYFNEMDALRIDAVGDGLKFYNLLATGQFFQITFSKIGLSTSLAQASAFSVNKNFKNALKDEVLFALSPIFANYEFRMGGGISRKFDISLLGTFAYYPAYHEMFTTMGFSYIDGLSYFVGVELSTRISPFNFNVKVGQMTYQGNYNFFVKRVNESYSKEKSVFYYQPFDLSNFCVSVGFTLGNSVAKGSRMLRLWSKPLIANY